MKGPLQTVVIGTDAPGTVLETCSPDFLALFEKPGLQISKGQGNYEALSARGEFSIMVGDPWQGKGIGSVLLKKCLQIARSMQIKSVRGYVLSDNHSMIKLGRKLGFKSAGVPGSGETELRMDLTAPDSSQK